METIIFLLYNYIYNHINFIKPYIRILENDNTAWIRT